MDVSCAMNNVLKIKHGLFCTGGRLCSGTRRLNCEYEDLAISSSMQPICCTAQKTMSEVSSLGALQWLRG